MGYLGSCLILIGMWLLGKKQREGFLFGVAGESCWFLRGYYSVAPDLMSLSIIFIIINIWNFYKWRKKDVKDIIIEYEKNLKDQEKIFEQYRKK